MSRRRVLVVGLADEGFLALTADGTAGRGPAAAGVDSGALSRTLRGVGLGWQARLEPQGIVEPGAEYEAVVENLRARLLAFRDPATGAPVLTAVHRREEAYRGPHADGGPDLLVETARTVCMVEGLGRLRLMPAGVGPEERTGDHPRIVPRAGRAGQSGALGLAGRQRQSGGPSTRAAAPRKVPKGSS